ncbi:FtsX-like permease family protein [Candidatus Poribacteria bacterium]|nr:FtsX-like permease family protein [Candidatus Poribacteria bacterium]
MVTLKIAFRNTLRQKRRTILTALTMLVGFILASVSIGWAGGTYSHVIDMFTRNRIGHIQIHAKGYMGKPSLHKSISQDRPVFEKIKNQKGIESWTSRVYSVGLASLKEKTGGIQITGIDVDKEVKTTNFDKKITQGRNLSKDSYKEALIGKGLSKILLADVGDDVIVISQGADGSIANDIYTVVGITDSGNEEADRTGFYIDLSDAQNLLVLGKRIHEIVIVCTDLDKVKKITNTLKSELAEYDLEVSPWQETAKSFYNAMQADLQGMWLMIFVIVLIIAVQVLNSVLMSVLERTREYGVLKAVGTRPFQVFKLVIFEVSIIAVASVLIGSLLSTFINHLLSVYGINLSEPFSYGGIEFNKLSSQVSARSVYLPAIIVILSSAGISVIPAIRAARTVAAKAMRSI